MFNQMCWFKKPSIGLIVTVGNPVAKASVMEGTLLHGTEIPNGYLKLSIKGMCDEALEIPLQFKRPFDDDDDYLVDLLPPGKWTHLIKIIIMLYNDVNP